MGSLQSCPTNPLLNVVKTNRPVVDILYCTKEADISNRDQIAGWTGLHQKVAENTLTQDDIKDISPSKIDTRDLYGQSPMWTACNLCHFNMYELLKKNNVNLHQTDNQKRNLLHAIASGNNHTCDIIAMDLVKNGVSLKVKDIAGNTPIDDLNYEPSIINTENDVRIRNNKETLRMLNLFN
jgi:ankyrin repeat protein